MPRLLPALAAVVLLHPAMALAQAETTSPAPISGTADPTTAAPAQPASGMAAPPSGKPTPAQQAVLDRIRRMRDGDQRRFGSCSYRWDRWKLQADGSRTTSYSCEGTKIVDRMVGVHCSKLQINSYDPLPEGSGKGEGWAWGSWRLPQAGGEEQMVATLCANALPIPASAPATAGSSAPAARSGAGTPPRTGASPTPRPSAAPAGSR